MKDAKAFELAEMTAQAADAANDYIRQCFKGAPLTDQQLALNGFAAGFVAGIIWRDKTLNLREWNNGDTRELFNRPTPTV